MSTHLITGYAGKEHITSADQGSFNAAVMGGGEFVLERGEQFRCQVISNNKVRIYDGDALMQGRHIIIDRNTYEETTHENGTQGYKRIDLIVLTYEKDAASSVESVKLEVIKGEPAENNPIVPQYTTGDVLNSGASKNQMPLYKIPFDGLSIGVPVQLFSTVPTLEGMKTDVDEKVDAKIAEFENDFAELEAGIEDKIAEAGKPLSSNAEDWAMIENYGEYSADAKTVGEEFAKVNDSLGDIMAVGNSTYNSVEKLLQYYIDKGYLPSLNSIPLVPKMTSNTSSVGQTISSTPMGSGYEAWRGFNQSSSDFFNTQANGAYLGFKFNNPVCVKSFKYVSKGPSWSIASGKIQACNDGNSWVDLTDTITFTSLEASTAVNYSGKVNNNSGYLYYRLLAVTKDVNASVMELQFYGYEM